MSIRKQIQISDTKVSNPAIGLLIFILLFGLQGQKAYDGLWIHEFSHDMRHAAGFPCH